MPQAPVDEQVLEGRRALEAAQWTAARAAFEAALATADTPDARDGLGQALWFLGQVDEAIAARQRAFGDFVREGRCDAAARAAVWVSHQYFIAGRGSAARGWLARAERALEGQDRCAGHGWIAVERARHADDVQECAALATRALEVAVETGAPELEVFALSLLGRAAMRAGRREEGLRLLEEAMAAASADGVRDIHSLGEAYCNLIMACTTAGEWEQAAEWCHLVDEFAREHDATPLLGACRTVHADVLLACGRWTEAERSLNSALAAHARAVPAMSGPTLATLAELRVRQGRLAEAESLLRGRAEHASALSALAQLRLAEGRPEVACVLLERGLAGAR